MKRILLAAALILAPLGAQAEQPDPVVADIVNGHILPRFETLAKTAQALSDAATQECAPTSVPLRDAYGTAFDAWVSASHLRFGPTEVDDRAFALAFWPDSRGATPRSLTALISDLDPIATSPESYADVSIAARGFYALEFLLFDETLREAGDPAYHCTLIQTISSDIALTSQAILQEWQNGYVETMYTPGPTATYRSTEEVLQEMLRALSAGLQFTSDSRLGRPLGTFDRPRPTRAEARRSERSAQHVLLSLNALQDLSARLAASHPALAARLDQEFEGAKTKLTELNDPIFASVAQPQSRLKVEIVQQAVDTIRNTVSGELGPTLGVAAGFNSLDGD